jgi:hypothetical protein
MLIPEPGKMTPELKFSLTHLEAVDLIAAVERIERFGRGQNKYRAADTLNYALREEQAQYVGAARELANFFREIIEDRKEVTVSKAESKI